MTTTIQIEVEHPHTVSHDKVLEIFKMLIQIGKSDAIQTVENGEGDLDNARVAVSLEFGEPTQVG